MNSSYEFKLERSVEFVETDMAGIVHFSNFFRYAEAAEHAYFASLGLSLHEHKDSAMSGWARVKAECDYRAPLRYRDRFEVHLLIAAKTERSLTYQITFRKIAEGNRTLDPPEIVARGRLVVVHVERAPGEEMLRSAPMPAAVDDALDVAPPDLL